MLVCKICGHQSKSIQRGLTQHLVMAHNMKVLEYFIKYENFEIPKCECGQDNRYASGLSFRNHCGDIECARKIKKPLSNESRQKIRDGRLRFLKAHPEATAWRLGNKQSWPERFFEQSLLRHSLHNQFKIVKEYSVFPYYIDFAFIDINVAVEIDGSQHLTDDRKDYDAKRDVYLETKGWRIFRISADKLYSIADADMVITEFKNFINSNSIFDNCGIITAKELRVKEQFLLKQQKENKEIENTANKLKALSNINFNAKRWTILAADILGVKSNVVRKVIRRDFPDFYIENCTKGSHRSTMKNIQVE